MANELQCRGFAQRNSICTLLSEQTQVSGFSLLTVEGSNNSMHRVGIQPRLPIPAMHHLSRQPAVHRCERSEVVFVLQQREMNVWILSGFLEHHKVFDIRSLAFHNQRRCADGVQEVQRGAKANFVGVRLIERPGLSAIVGDACNWTERDDCAEEIRGLRCEQSECTAGAVAREDDAVGVDKRKRSQVRCGCQHIVDFTEECFLNARIVGGPSHGWREHHNALVAICRCGLIVFRSPPCPDSVAASCSGKSAREPDDRGAAISRLDVGVNREVCSHRA